MLSIERFNITGTIKIILATTIIAVVATIEIDIAIFFNFKKNILSLSNKLIILKIM